jgi:outer membrane receptor for ferrienterochelin and colicin
MSLGGCVFRNEVQDEIVFANTKAQHIVGADTVNIYQYRNIGKARYEGVEGQIRLLLPRRIKAQTGISYLRGYSQETLDSQKKDLDLLSQLKANWNISRIFFKKFNFGLQGLHLFSRKAAAGNALYPNAEMPDVFVLNLYLHVDPFWKGLGSHIKIENVLDKEWSDVPGTSSSASPELPQARRRISLELNWLY